MWPNTSKRNFRLRMTFPTYFPSSTSQSLAQQQRNIQTLRRLALRAGLIRMTRHKQPRYSTIFGCNIPFCFRTSRLEYMNKNVASKTRQILADNKIARIEKSRGHIFLRLSFSSKVYRQKKEKKKLGRGGGPMRSAQLHTAMGRDG